MDIVDILMAQALSPQGQISTYAALAQSAVTQANEALAAIQEITGETDGVTNLIDSLDFNVTSTNTEEYIKNQLDVTYPSEKQFSINPLVKLYKTLGNNEDGAVTQKALTIALNEISSAGSNIEILNTYDGVDLLARTEEGNIALTGIRTEDLVQLLAINQLYHNSDVAILYNNYDEWSSTVEGKSIYNLHCVSGRRRCNVSSDGTIVAFEGEDSFKNDGSNGNVMVYMPKFYYLRLTTSVTPEGNIKKETLCVSDTKRAGFKLHPAFYDADGEELDYILYSAYEGGLYDASANSVSYDGTATIDALTDHMVSYANIKPISNFNIGVARTLANNNNTNTNNGTWGITDIYADSANQILFSFVSKDSLISAGISYNSPQANYNSAALTGSTNAEPQKLIGSTPTYLVNGTATQSAAGGFAINFLGIENIYGNLWKYVDCVSYDSDNLWIKERGTNNTTNVGALPSGAGWIQYFKNYADNYNYLFIPGVVGGNATSEHPVGDYYWPPIQNEAYGVGVFGGHAASGDNNGMFYYAFDVNSSLTSYTTGARLMFIPKKNASNYAANVALAATQLPIPYKQVNAQ